MRNTLLSTLALCAISACTTIDAQTEASQSQPLCTLAQEDAETLAEWRESAFADQLNDAAARDFASCLGHASPFLRDQIGYEGLTAALRSGNISEATRRDLITELSEAVSTPSADGFVEPFSALGLAELARTDRVAPFLTPEERSALTQTAAAYLSQVTDFRAYSDTEGWRHGVAHGADFAMQLALNPNLEAPNLRLLRDAITAQITARSGHAFTFGEPERLARPIFFMANHPAFADANWIDWFAALGSAAPLADWGEAFQSETDLARLHNLKAFARVIYINASLSENDAFTPLAEGALGLLRTLP